MTENGSHILVDIDEADLPQLLEALFARGRAIRICKGGEPIAELSAVGPRHRLPPVDPRLKPEFAPDYDPAEGLSEDDWPNELR
jgi:antitoxin (DNA-binding transcriptional repressor) of toxin-antitoxin stability system